MSDSRSQLERGCLCGGRNKATLHNDKEAIQNTRLYEEPILLAGRLFLMKGNIMAYVGDKLKITNLNSPRFNQVGEAVREGVKGGWHVRFKDGEVVYIPFGYVVIESDGLRAMEGQNDTIN